MAFALTKFRAYGLEPGGPTRCQLQRLQFTIKGTGADVALDVGTLAGTFWTAAKADATYGAMATEVLARLTAFCVDANCSVVTKVGGNPINDKVRATAAGAGTYTLSISNYLPVITLNAAEGLTDYVLCVEVALVPTIKAMYADFGA